LTGHETCQSEPLGFQDFLSEPTFFPLAICEPVGFFRQSDAGFRISRTAAILTTQWENPFFPGKVGKIGKIGNPPFKAQ